MRAELVVMLFGGCGAAGESASEGDGMRPPLVDVNLVLDDGSTITASEGLAQIPTEASVGGDADCGASIEFHQTEVRQLDLHSPAFLEVTIGTRSVLDPSAWLTWTDADGVGKAWNGVLSVVEWTDALHSFDLIEGVLCTDSDTSCVPSTGSLTTSTWVPDWSEAWATVTPGSWTDQATNTRLCEGVFSAETGGGG